MDLRSRIRAILAEHGTVPLDQLDTVTDRILEAISPPVDHEQVAVDMATTGW